MKFLQKGEFDMKTVFTLFFGLFAVQNVMALGELNCTNAERTLIREEKEIWGANPINYYVDGVKTTITKEHFYKNTKVIHVSIINTKEGSGEEIFTIRMTITKEDGNKVSDFVLCRKWWDQNID